VNPNTFVVGFFLWEGGEEYMAFNTRVVNIWGNAAPDMGNTSGTDTTMRFWNTGTGNALQVDSAGTVASLVVTQNAVGGATIAPLQVIASTASQAVLAIGGAFFSTASINLAASQTAFVIPVYHSTNQTWGYINVSKGVA